jgi:hypothetical protein
MDTSDVDAIMTRLRHDAARTAPAGDETTADDETPAGDKITAGDDAMARAAVAISRAQELLADMFCPPIPPPRAVEAMPLPHGQVRQAALLLASRPGRLTTRRLAVHQHPARAGRPLGAGGHRVS